MAPSTRWKRCTVHGLHELEQKSFADVDAFLHEELAAKCARVLADAGVYKQTKEGREGLMRFIDAWKEEVRHGH